jgi:hypothetical protein
MPDESVPGMNVHIPANESFSGTALLVEFRIEPDRFFPLRMFPGSFVDWIGLDPLFPVV